MIDESDRPVIAAMIQAAIDRALELAPIPVQQPATVVSQVAGADYNVLLDVDAATSGANIVAQDITGSPGWASNSRVMVALIAPHGAQIIGPIGGATTGVPTGLIVMGWDSITPPQGWHLCDGSVGSRAAFANLTSAKAPGGTFSAPYGNGDGSTTFAFPNLKDRFLVGAGTTYPIGGTGGEATHVLTVAELAGHTHPLVDSGGFTPGVVNRSLAAGGVGNYERGGTGVLSAGATGSNQAHENRPPYLSLWGIVKL